MAGPRRPAERAAFALDLPARLYTSVRKYSMISHLGKIPTGVSACLFDLDGVLTKTAQVHAAAWKQMFDGFLLDRSRQAGKHFRMFDPSEDYREYVDGKLRSDGVRSFLASRSIVLDEGSADDPPSAQTVHGLGTRKNQLFLDILRSDGVDVYEGSRRFVQAAQRSGLRRAVVSASSNCQEVLAAAQMEDLFEVRIDGLVARRDHLRGKPEPDMFLAAAAILGTTPESTAVFEDAIAGVQAGRAGGFGWVVGVDRTGNAASLMSHGADMVVTDLAQLLDER